MTDTGNANPAPIDFWFDFSSPYGYLLSEKIDALAAQYGRKVRWHPILLGIIFKTIGGTPLTLQNAAKASYSLHDIARSARFMGLPYRHPDKFPLPTQNAARAYYWLHGQDCALARAFAHAAYRALFVDNIDISAPETVLEIAAKNGTAKSGDQGAPQGRSR
jgi:2-hydroxychromene-2-carboxylate isomerase